MQRYVAKTKDAKTGEAGDPGLPPPPQKNPAFSSPSPPQRPKPKTLSHKKTPGAPGVRHLTPSAYSLIVIRCCQYTTTGLDYMQG